MKIGFGELSLKLNANQGIKGDGKEPPRLMPAVILECEARRLYFHHKIRGIVITSEFVF